MKDMKAKEAFSGISSIAFHGVYFLCPRAATGDFRAEDILSPICVVCYVLSSPSKKPSQDFPSGFNRRIFRDGTPIFHQAIQGLPEDF